jgi:hypothetical protein
MCDMCPKDKVYEKSFQNNDQTTYKYCDNLFIEYLFKLIIL